mmetsp:Transcript_71255/g.111526  ORF Transcript_71255/g.111526 Transcript_71255/m.111526 type:complete len:95 (-) Transcript_71255:98-382(-)
MRSVEFDEVKVVATLSSLHPPHGLLLMLEEMASTTKTAHECQALKVASVSSDIARHEQHPYLLNGSAHGVLQWKGARRTYSSPRGDVFSLGMDD